MSSRLVAASLPPDARMEAAAAPQWDEDDQRPTEPWLPPSGDWHEPSLSVSLRAPKLPRELVDLEHGADGWRLPPRPRTPPPRTPPPSGIRPVSQGQLRRLRAPRR